TALGPGGAIEAFLEAREKGLVRFLGITVHSQEVALDAISRFDFDTILFPINFSYWHNCDAGPRILEEAAKKGMGRVAMKSMALRPWCDDQEHQAGKWKKTWYRPIDDPALVELAVRFTLSQDINVMLPPGHLELFEMAMKVAESFRPIEPSEVERLREVAAGLTPIFPTPESS
ncbi:MAG: aldo/keto reductase, partial [Armatimonadetes bacterium]|nr:aldo/keto reductase [Armatimonadota bacterium]